MEAFVAQFNLRDEFQDNGSWVLDWASLNYIFKEFISIEQLLKINQREFEQIRRTGTERIGMHIPF